MNLIQKIVFAVMAIAVFSLVGCSDSKNEERIQDLNKALVEAQSSNKEKDQKIEELTNSISKLEKEKKVLQDEIKKLKNTENDQSKESAKTSSEPTKDEKFAGTYEFEDQYGTTWVLELTSGRRATIRGKNSSRKAYGTFRFFSGGPTIYFEDEVPRVLFPNYNEGGSIMTISSDGQYIYETRDAARAQNPRQRLKIRKVK